MQLNSKIENTQFWNLFVVEVWLKLYSHYAVQQ